MKIYDISLPIHPQLPVWPGDPPIELTRQESIAEGSDANVSRIACGVHIGTHVDAALHFIDGGATIGDLDLNRYALLISNIRESLPPMEGGQLILEGSEVTILIKKSLA